MAQHIKPPIETTNDFIEEWRNKPSRLQQPVLLNEFFYSFLMTIAFGMGIVATIWGLWELFNYLIYLFI